MMKKIKARLVATGSYVPDRVLSNNDLEKMVETSDDWITSRTGIKERRLAAEGEYSSTMGAEAARRTLVSAEISVADVDLILVATMTPDYLSPSTAALIQQMIGAKNAAAVDFQAACSGFLYGLSMAKAFVEAGMYKNVLLIATEKMSSFVDYKDRNTCVLFGDGASAALICGEGAGLAIDQVSLGADGTVADIFIIPAGGAKEVSTAETVSNKRHYIQMQGKEVFRHAVRRMEEAARSCLKEVNLTIDQISWLVPHQANLRIIKSIGERLDLPSEKIYVNVAKYGNTSASSVPLALDELLNEKVVQEGEHLMLVAFGAGVTWGVSLLTKVAS
jgi:3-oxoacyl-[acyl-carrier-protein] synthase III